MTTTIENDDDDHDDDEEDEEVKTRSKSIAPLRSACSPIS